MRWLLAVVLLGSACGPFRVERTTSKYPAYPPNCSFGFLATRDQCWLDVATIEVEQEVHWQLEEFLRQIGPTVCKLGGQMVYADPRGDGTFVKAWVMVPNVCRGM